VNLSNAEERLREEFAGIFSPETIAERLHESYAKLNEAARIDSFVVLFAERFTRERLRAAGAGRREHREGRARGSLRLRPQRRSESDSRCSSGPPR
jgi:hypothetical protein